MNSKRNIKQLAAAIGVGAYVGLWVLAALMGWTNVINILIVLVLVVSLLIAVMALTSKASGISTIFGYTIQPIQSKGISASRQQKSRLGIMATE